MALLFSGMVRERRLAMTAEKKIDWVSDCWQLRLGSDTRYETILKLLEF